MQILERNGFMFDKNNDENINNFLIDISEELSNYFRMYPIDNGKQLDTMYKIVYNKLFLTGLTINDCEFNDGIKPKDTSLIIDNLKHDFEVQNGNVISNGSLTSDTITLFMPYRYDDLEEATEKFLKFLDTEHIHYTAQIPKKMSGISLMVKINNNEKLEKIREYIKQDEFVKNDINPLIPKMNKIGIIAEKDFDYMAEIAFYLSLFFKDNYLVAQESLVDEFKDRIVAFKTPNDFKNIFKHVIPQLYDLNENFEITNYDFEQRSNLFKQAVAELFVEDFNLKAKNALNNVVTNVNYDGFELYKELIEKNNKGVIDIYSIMLEELPNCSMSEAVDEYLNNFTIKTKK